MSDDQYKEKYLKYKAKYLELKRHQRGGATSNLGNTFEKIGKKTGQVVDTTGQIFKATADTTGDLTGYAFKKVGDTSSEVIGKTGDVIGETFENITGYVGLKPVGKLGHNIASTTTHFVGDVLSTTGKVGDKAVHLVTDTTGKALGTVGKIGSATLETAGELAGSTIDSGKSLLGSVLGLVGINVFKNGEAPDNSRFMEVVQKLYDSDPEIKKHITNSDVEKILAVAKTKSSSSNDYKILFEGINKHCVSNGKFTCKTAQQNVASALTILATGLPIDMGLVEVIETKNVDSILNKVNELLSKADSNDQVFSKYKKELSTVKDNMGKYCNSNGMLSDDCAPSVGSTIRSAVESARK